MVQKRGLAELIPSCCKHSVAQPFPSGFRLAVLTASYRIPSCALVDGILFTLLPCKDFFPLNSHLFFFFA